MKWKFSKFLYFLRGTEKSILFNTANGSVLMLNDIEAGTVEALLNLSFYEQDIAPDLFRIFAEKKAIVESDKDETECIIQEYSNAVMNQENLHLTLFVTDECNFKCDYCFVYKEKRNVMTPEVFDRVYRFIEKKLGSYKSLSISWFGGEPLERIEYVIEYSRRLKELCEKNEKDYSFLVVTNGYHLNLKNAQLLCEAGVKSFQITFDGDKEQHDLIRKCGEQPTFSTIFKNVMSLRYLRDWDTHIVVRCNEGNNSIDGFIEKFEKYFAKDGRFVLQVKPIVNYDSDSSKYLLGIYSGQIEQLKNYANKYPSLRSHLNGKFYPRRRWCGTLSPHSLVLNPEGKIYTCDSTVNNAKFCVGEIDAEGNMQENPLFDKEYFEWRPDKKCMSCKRFPLCYGSCQRIFFKTKVHACAYSDKDIIEYLKYLLLQED